MISPSALISPGALLSRRAMIGGCAAGVVASAAGAHTLYPQWVAYRRKHLLIGCHRKAPETYELATQLVERINHHLPKAKARAARAPHPERLASLIGTDQMEVAVLPISEALLMRDGFGSFAAYGKLALTRIAEFGAHVLVAEQGFPERHAWMLSAAVAEAGHPADGGTSGLPLHAGVVAWREGVALADLPTD